MYLPLWAVNADAPNANLLLGPDDIDVAITNWRDPLNSPHWTSRTTNVTYATALRVALPRIDAGLAEVPRVLYIQNLVPAAEFHTNMFSFSESAAIVYADSARRRPVGTAFVEQFLQ